MVRVFCIYLASLLYPVNQSNTNLDTATKVFCKCGSDLYLVKEIIIL